MVTRDETDDEKRRKLTEALQAAHDGASALAREINLLQQRKEYDVHALDDLLRTWLTLSDEANLLFRHLQAHDDAAKIERASRRGE